MVNKIYVDTLSDETKRYVNSVTPFINKQNQYTATNNINMSDFTLQNVGKDVATKGYVDNSGGGAFEVRNGGYNAKGPLYIGGHKIGGIKDPKKGGEATNKRYVDNYVQKYANDYVEKFKDVNGFLASPWDINMTGKKLSCLSFPSKSDEAATREYADKVGNDVREYTDRSSELLGERFKFLQFAFFKDNGKFVAYTPISMASQPLRDLTEPKETNDAATKKYVDDLIADNVGEGNMNGGGSPFFKANGNYQASYTINMAFKKLLNLSTPSEPFEAATKEYVDNVVESLNNIIDKRPHIIAVHTHYYGNLIKDKYQFTFGESKSFSEFAGFLIPHSGRIKKISSRVEDMFYVTGSLFSFLLTRKGRNQIRLADFIFERGNYDKLKEHVTGIVEEMPHRGLAIGGGVTRKKNYFDNDLENYPLLEGDLINIKTQKNIYSRRSYS